MNPARSMHGAAVFPRREGGGIRASQAPSNRGVRPAPEATGRRVQKVSL